MSKTDKTISFQVQFQVQVYVLGKYLRAEIKERFVQSDLLHCKFCFSARLFRLSNFQAPSFEKGVRYLISVCLALEVGFHRLPIEMVHSF